VSRTVALRRATRHPTRVSAHFLFKEPWSELLVDYDITQGSIWVLVPIVTGMAPWLMAKVRGLLL